ncbi:unnamed protein product [Thlaspi arvense]|uniref:Large ribosomal subunit protein uL15/eL18 domain-containing protein n=1 Tax=Thlaspi arvense TaxID=13288 RepID=A0AAU9SCL4_THLAR|nr:unnamed protein product [Thlaspi arvense]
MGSMPDGKVDIATSGMLVETRGTPMVMASMLSLSSATVTKTPPILRNSSPFKGNARNLRANSCPFSSLKIHLKGTQSGRPLVVVSRASLASAPVAALANVRFRLDNLGPQPGSRKKAKRKGRGISAGQGGSCGFGMRGQKSRSGPGVRKGFEGGQMPLYRRIPKLRGIAGGLLELKLSGNNEKGLIYGCLHIASQMARLAKPCGGQMLRDKGYEQSMHAGLPKYVPVNLKDIEAAGFQEGEEVSLESLKNKGLINPSGRERTLPLKILGDGELSVKLNFKARAFSASAREKLEAAGCSLTVLPGRKKWVKPSVAKNLARAEEYFAKKRAAADSGDGSSS